jgi:hypothetical protein
VKWPWRKSNDTVDATIRELEKQGSRALAVALRATTRELSDAIDLLTATSSASTTEHSNPYPSRKQRVEQILKCYRGEATWGGAILRRLLNIRRAWQMPKGLQLVPADKANPAKAELAYLKAVLDANNLNEGQAQRLVREKEFEGQVLVQLVWEPALGVVLRTRPHRVMEYDVVLADVHNPNGPKRAQFKKNGGIVETLEDDEFAFVSFNSDGETQIGNPDLGDVLWYSENADRALYAWRKFNRLFAHLTPFFETEDAQVAQRLQEYIKQVGWKIGLALAANAKMSLVGPDAAPGDMLRSELTTNVQMICGISGVEPQDIGFPDILSNRAVATEMGEPQEAAIQADITLWIGFFEDLTRKIIRLRNSRLFGQLDEDAVVAEIKTGAGRDWLHLKEIFLPAAQAGVIDSRTFIERIPDINVEEVVARTELAKKEKQQSQLRGLGLLAREPFDGGEDEDE